MTGLSEQAPGAYAQQVLAEESLLFEVPNGLEPAVAALTEPMSVAWHAVRRGEVGKRDVAIVIGCGPVGLAVILCLKAQGVRTVVAATAHRAGVRWHRPAVRTWSSTRRRTLRTRPSRARGR